MLCASVDDEQSESSLAEVKSQIKLILRRLNRNAEPQATIESGDYTLQYGEFLLSLPLYGAQWRSLCRLSLVGQRLPLCQTEISIMARSIR